MIWDEFAIINLKKNLTLRKHQKDQVLENTNDIYTPCGVECVVTKEYRPTYMNVEEGPLMEF